MAAQTIREVVIKARLELQSGDLKAVADQQKAAQAQASAAQKAANQQSLLEKKGVLAQEAEDHRAALKKKLEESKVAAQQETAILREAVKQRKLLRQEEAEMASATRKEEARIRQENAARPAFGLEGAPKGGPIAAASVVITAAQTFLNAPKLLGPLAEQINGLKAEFQGGQMARERGIFTKPGADFWEALGLFQPQQAPQRLGPDELRKKEIDLLKTQKDKVEEIKREQEDLYRRQLDSIRTQKQAAEQHLKTLQDSVDRAKEEYGLLTQTQRQSVQNIAAKIKSGGVGSLSDIDLEIAQKFAGFRGLIKAESEKNADLTGFNELIRGLSGGDALDAARKKLDAVIQQEVKITAKIDAVENLGEKISEQLAPLLREQFDKAVAILAGDIKKMEAVRKGNLGAVAPLF